MNNKLICGDVLQEIDDVARQRIYIVSLQSKDNNLAKIEEVAL